MSVEQTVGLIRGAVVDVDIAGAYSPVRGGALDHASWRIAELTEDDYSPLIDASWQSLIREDDRSAARLSKIFGNEAGIYAATGYMASINLLSNDSESVRLFSASGRVEPDNPIQLAVEMYAEDGFCVASLAIIKTLRQMAYLNRPANMRRLDPYKWAESYGREPFTLGWSSTEESVLLGAAGFTPSQELLGRLSRYTLTSIRLFKGQEGYGEFTGSGLADQTIVNGCESVDQAVELGRMLAIQGANLNL